MNGMPSDLVLKTRIKDLISSVDLQSTGIKKFISILSEEFHVNLKPRKEFITAVVTQILTASSNDTDNDDDDTEIDESEDENLPRPVKKNSSSSKKVVDKQSSKSGGSGLTVRKEISNKLAKFLRKGNSMSRTDIVKSLWEYIRENNLQNPSNKREILLDDKMKEVFECETFTMFTMNKYIGAHIHPFKPVDLTTNSTKPKPTKRKNKEKGKKNTKKRKAGSQPPYRLSVELQAVVNEPILPRPQVVSKIWVYIKENNLQNERNKREIICDDKLKAVMKKSKVTMFEMNALISNHLIEKVDKSEYVHKEELDAEEDEEEESEDDDDDDGESDDEES